NAGSATELPASPRGQSLCVSRSAAPGVFGKSWALSHGINFGRTNASSMTTAHQPELHLSTPAPKVGAEDVRWMVRVLEQAGGWITGQEIYERTQGWSNARDGAENFKRRLRAIAEFSAGEIIGGAKGYRLLKHATPHDVKTTTDALVSQGKKM